MIPDEKSCAEALKKDQPLLPYQIFYLDYQLYAPNKCIVNCPYILKIPKKMVSLEDFANAVNCILHKFAIFGTVFTFNEEGNLIQRYCPDLIQDVEIEQISEEDYWQIYRPNLLQPHHKLNHLMYRLKLYETEENGYFFYDISHVLFDGNANKNLLKLIFHVLHGGEIPQDAYYFYLEKMAKKRKNEDAKIDFEFLKHLYADTLPDKLPSPDVFDRGNFVNNEFLKTKYTLSQYEEAAKRKNTTINKALISAALLTIHRFNQKNQVAVEWTYHGRNEEWKKQLVGLTLCAIPASVNFSLIKDTDDLLAAVNEQANIGYHYAEYSYALHQSSPSADEYLRIAYQKNIDFSNFVPAGFELEQNYDALNGLPNMLQAVIYPGESEEPLSFIFAGNVNRYTAQRIQKLGKLLLQAFDECLLS